MKTAYVALAVLCALMPVSGSAAEPESKPIASESPAHSSRDVDLRSLLLDVGGRMHKQFAWDPRLPQTMDLSSLDRREITFPQLLAVLQLHGFAVITDGTLSEVVPDVSVRQAALPLVAPDNIKALDDEWVTTIVPVRGMSAVQLVTVLRPLVPLTGQINALSERNAIIIAARTAIVKQMVALIHSLEGLPPAAPTPSQ